MRRFVFLFFFSILLHALPSCAAEADAREVARMNNCSPKKIGVYSQTLGPDSQTIYRIDCNMPKTEGGLSSREATGLLVQCNGTLCQILRPISGDGKN